VSQDRLHPHVRGRGMASARSRTRLIEHLRSLQAAGEPVLAAMQATQRHLFVDEAMSSRAYDNTALPIGHGQTISQPFIVAHMTELLLDAGEPPQTVLEIGTGSGYQAAVLARLVDSVYTVECVPALYRLAKRRLARLQYRNIHVRPAREDALGLADYGPYDAILVAAGAETLPVSLYPQLRDGGRLIVPVGPEGQQQLIVVDRHGDDFCRQELDTVSFVPLIAG